MATLGGNNGPTRYEELLIQTAQPLWDLYVNNPKAKARYQNHPTDPSGTPMRQIDAPSRPTRIWHGEKIGEYLLEKKVNRRVKKVPIITVENYCRAFILDFMVTRTDYPQNITGHKKFAVEFNQSFGGTRWSDALEMLDIIEQAKLQLANRGFFEEEAEEVSMPSPGSSETGSCDYDGSLFSDEEEDEPHAADEAEMEDQTAVGEDEYAENSDDSEKDTEGEDSADSEEDTEAEDDITSDKNKGAEEDVLSAAELVNTPVPEPAAGPAKVTTLEPSVVESLSQCSPNDGRAAGTTSPELPPVVKRKRRASAPATFGGFHETFQKKAKTNHATTPI